MVQSLYVMSGCRNMRFNEKYFVLKKLIETSKDKKRKGKRRETYLFIHTIHIYIYIWIVDKKDRPHITKKNLISSNRKATGVQYGSVVFLDPETQSKLNSLQTRLQLLNKLLAQFDAKESGSLNIDDIDLEEIDKELQKLPKV